MSYQKTLTTEDAFARYEDVRHRLPQATFPTRSIHARSLADIADQADAFVLDAFGVLNVGLRPIPGAVARMATLRALGKRLVVLTNAASAPRAAALRKYKALGFDFAPEEVVASREVCATRLAEALPHGTWGAISADGDDFADINACVLPWTATDQPQVDGFLMLSSAQMDAATESALREALLTQPRPLLVANPDIVAPREEGLSCEPGYFAHRLADQTGITPVFFGKPFPNAFEDVKKRLPDCDPRRVIMVGDTLHTDVLGGAAAGFRTALISDFGLFAGQSIPPFIEQSGIRPDFICPTT